MPYSPSIIKLIMLGTHKVKKFPRLEPAVIPNRKKTVNKSLVRAAIIVPCLLLIVYAMSTAYKIYAQQKEQQNLAQYQEQHRLLAPATQKKIAVYPVRLKIPKLKIDAGIEYVEVTSTGEMGVPTNTENVGWYGFGPVPGQKGSAVIDGHYDQTNGKKAVFGNLDELTEGDKLYVEDSNGVLTTFVVRATKMYEPGFADIVFNQNDAAHLNLITCDGIWDKTKKSYTKRLVVFTDLAL